MNLELRANLHTQTSIFGGVETRALDLKIVTREHFTNFYFVYVFSMLDLIL